MHSLLAKYPVPYNGPDNTAQLFFDDMVKLFNAMLDKSDLYIAVRGGPVFWSTVISHSASGDPMATEEAANLVACYMEARSAYSPPQGDRVTNALTELVDQWMEVEAERRSLPPPGAFQATFIADPSGACDTPQGFRDLAFRPKVCETER